MQLQRQDGGFSGGGMVRHCQVTGDPVATCDCGACGDDDEQDEACRDDDPLESAG